MRRRNYEIETRISDCITRHHIRARLQDRRAAGARITSVLALQASSLPQGQRGACSDALDDWSRTRPTHDTPRSGVSMVSQNRSCRIATGPLMSSTLGEDPFSFGRSPDGPLYASTPATIFCASPMTWSRCFSPRKLSAYSL